MDEQSQALVSRIHSCSTAAQITALEDTVKEHVAQCSDECGQEILRIFNDRKTRVVHGTRVASDSTDNKDVYDFESVPWEDGMELVRAVVVDSPAAQNERNRQAGVSSADAAQKEIRAGNAGSRQGSNSPAQQRHGGQQGGQASDGGIAETSDNDLMQQATTPADIWNGLFHRKDYLEILRNKGLMGVLATCPFRGVCWRLFLGALCEDVDKWPEHAAGTRKEYVEIRSKFLVDPRSSVEADMLVNNPLSQDEKSPWYRYFQDEDLRDIIVRDVTRTFPDVQYFHSQRVYDMMTEILFCYSKLNPDISYRQGMHELLAPILMLVDQESICLDTTTAAVSEEMATVLNRQYVAHDTFTAFSRLMATMKPFFEVETHARRSAPRRTAFGSSSSYTGGSSGYGGGARGGALKRSLSAKEWLHTKHARDLHPDPEERKRELAELEQEERQRKEAEEKAAAAAATENTKEQGRAHGRPGRESPLKERLSSLQHELLKQHDPELYARLEELQIPPQVYGIRWIRLLFSREFPFASTLAVWDALLADFELLDYLCLAMLMYIRSYVLTHDYVESLSILMRYPDVQDVQFLIQKALHLRHPKSYPDPSGWVYVPKPEDHQEPESSLGGYLSQATEWTMGLVDAYLPHWLSVPTHVSPQMKKMRFAGTVQDFRKLELSRVQEALVRLGEEMEVTMEAMDSITSPDGRIRDMEKMFLLNVQLRKVCLTLLGRLPLEVENFPRVAHPKEASALPPELREEQETTLEDLEEAQQQRQQEQAQQQQQQQQQQKQKPSSRQGRRQQQQQQQQQRGQRAGGRGRRGNGGGGQTPKRPASRTQRGSGGGGGFFGLGRGAKAPPETEIKGGRVVPLPEVAFEARDEMEEHRRVLRENLGHRYEVFTSDTNEDAHTSEAGTLRLAFARLPPGRTKREPAASGKQTAAGDSGESDAGQTTSSTHGGRGARGAAAKDQEAEEQQQQHEERAEGGIDKASGSDGGGGGGDDVGRQGQQEGQSEEHQQQHEQKGGRSRGDSAAEDSASTKERGDANHHHRHHHDEEEEDDDDDDGDGDQDASRATADVARELALATQSGQDDNGNEDEDSEGGDGEAVEARTETEVHNDDNQKAEGEQAGECVAQERSASANSTTSNLSESVVLVNASDAMPPSDSA